MHCLPNPAVTEQCLQLHPATSATVFNFDIKHSYYQHWISNTCYNAMFAGLSCHSCNSIYDRRCGDPYDAYTTEIVDCEQVNTIKFGVGIFLIFYFYKRYWWISQNLTSSLNILLQVLIALQLMILLPQERRKLTHVEGIESFAAFCRKTVQTGSMCRFLILLQLLGIISRRQLGPFEQLKKWFTFSGWRSARPPFLWLRP